MTAVAIAAAVVAAAGLASRPTDGLRQSLRLPAPGPAAQHHTARPRGLALAGPAIGRPLRLQIPEAGVDARVSPVGLLADRSLEVPADPSRAGWWIGGARPGRAGAAVIVGHVNSRRGPGVFAELGKLRPGSMVEVSGRAGRRTFFVVARVRHYPKNKFPTRKVYAATRRPTLRLITCSGAFDRRSGHYVDNTVVFAELASAPAALR